MSEIILIDINAHTGSAPVTLRYATQGYVSPAPRTNLLTYSDGTIANLPVAFGVTNAASPISASFTNSIQFSGSSTIYAYKVFTTIAATTYTLSVFVKMDDSGVPVCGTNSTTGDFSLTLDQNVMTTVATATSVGDGVYRVQNSVVGSGNAGQNFGVARYSTQSLRGFRVTGYQLEANPAATAYIPTTTAAVTVPTAGQENLYYEGRIKQPGNIQRSIFDKGSTFGASKVGYGEVVLVNNDGALDGFLTYGFAGFGITIQRGTQAPNQSVPTWTTVLAGTMDSVDFSWSEVSIKVRDRQQELTKPLQQNRYGGTNSLPNGLDGVATDIKGNGRPILYGKALNFAPPRVNTTRIIYELSEGIIQSVDAVYERGTALTAGAAYSSQADMETNAPTAGQYRAWLNAAGSYIRLGSEPAGTVTVDATQGANVAARTPAQLMKLVLLKAGVINADITAADITALDTAATFDCGYWVPDSGNTGDTAGIKVMDALANSAGAWWGVDRLGKFRMGQIVAPLVGNSIGTLTAVDIIKIDRVRSTDQGGGVPSWQVKLNYARMNTVQVDLAAAVPTVLKSDRSEEWRTVLANDASIKTQWPKAQELEFDTHLISATDAQAEATRRLNLYKVRRDTLQARCKLPDALAASIDLGTTVVVQLGRFGMSAGKPYLVTGIRTDLRNNIFDLTLWG